MTEQQNYCTFVRDIPGWGQSQSTTLAIEFIMCFVAWYNQRPNSALYLIFFCAALKATAVPAFWVASQYTSDYSNTTCGVVTIILEIAWIFNDQLPSLSTAHRLTGLVLKRKLELMVMLFTGCSVLTGVILRVYRHSCRSGHCIGNESAVSEEHLHDSALALKYDILISLLASTTEIVLLILVYFQCQVLKSMTNQSLFQFYGKEVAVRLLVCLPLGIMEIIGYYFQTKTNPSGAIYWFCMIGIHARQMMGSILAMSIICSKQNAHNIPTKRASSIIQSRIGPPEGTIFNRQSRTKS